MGNSGLGAYSQTGFSYTGGQAKPIEDGIVVCSEFEEVITEVPYRRPGCDARYSLHKAFF
jgi:hypothetical protein